MKDLKKVCKLSPKNKDAREKYTEFMKAKKAKLFAESIAVEEKRAELDPEEYKVKDDYDGPRLESIEDVTLDWCQKLLEYQKDQKLLPPKYHAMILNWVRDHYEAQPSLVDVQVPEGTEISVCGDTHGQYYDLLTIFEKNGYPSETNPYLFNGDFVDRGSFSCEVALALMTYKVALPNHFHINRGNHEAKNMNKMYGFEGEVTKKYSAKFYDFYCDLFQKLPIAYCLDKKVLVVHGGLYSKDGVTLDDI